MAWPADLSEDIDGTDEAPPGAGTTAEWHAEVLHGATNATVNAIKAEAIAQFAATNAAVIAETARASAAEALLLSSASVGVTVASLVGGVIPTSQIPAVALSDYLGAVASQAAMLALVGQRGDYCTRTDGANIGTWILTGDDPTLIGNWLMLPTPAPVVQSVNGQIGPVVLGPGDVGADPAGTAATLVGAEALDRDAADEALAAAIVNETNRATAAESVNAEAIAAEASARATALDVVASLRPPRPRSAAFNPWHVPGYTGTAAALAVVAGRTYYQPILAHKAMTLDLAIVPTVAPGAAATVYIGVYVMDDDMQAVPDTPILATTISIPSGSILIAQALASLVLPARGGYVATVNSDVGFTARTIAEPNGVFQTAGASTNNLVGTAQVTEAAAPADATPTPFDSYAVNSGGFHHFLLAKRTTA